jgi:uncharacterized membrane protein YdjX (TVP38/TMEM64 family)
MQPPDRPALARLLGDRRFWLALAAIALIVAVRASGLGDLLSLETLRAYRAVLAGWVAGNTLVAATAYVAIYAAAVAVSVPGAVFLTLAGGFLFGALAGTLLTVIGAAAGACLVFLFARAILGPNALDRLGPAAARLAEAIRRNAWAYLLVLRLVPLFPFFLVNLVPAFVGVPLRVYALTTFFGIIPATAVFSLAGAGLGGVLDSGEPISIGTILSPEILAALAGLAGLSLLAIPLRKRFAR